MNGLSLDSWGSSQTAWWCNNHVETYEFVNDNGKDDIPYVMENNPAMFETTKQQINIPIIAMFDDSSLWPQPTWTGAMSPWDLLAVLLVVGLQR